MKKEEIRNLNRQITRNEIESAIKNLPTGDAYINRIEWKAETIQTCNSGIPGWRSGLAPAFGPGRDPGDPGSNPTSGSRCMEPASPSACVSASLTFSLCDYHK